MTALRFEVEGETEPPALEPTLNFLMHPDAERSEAAAEALAKVFKENIRLFTLITNTLAKDKEISDRWRGFKDVADSRHLGNRVEREVVEALVSAVRGAYRQNRASLLRDEGAMARQSRSLPTGTAMRRCPINRTACPLEGRASDRARGLRCLRTRRWRTPPSGSSMEPGSMRRCARARRPVRFSHPTVPSAHPYILLNYQGKPRDVMALGARAGPWRAPGAGGAARALAGADTA